MRKIGKGQFFPSCLLVPVSPLPINPESTVTARQGFIAPEKKKKSLKDNKVPNTGQSFKMVKCDMNEQRINTEVNRQQIYIKHFRDLSHATKWKMTFFFRLVPF